MLLEGNIISGEFDENVNEFSIQRVKYFTTESTVKEGQLNALYQYLKEHQDEMDGQIITLYDQMPVRLSQKEIKLLLEDIEKIKTLYN